MDNYYWKLGRDRKGQAVRCNSSLVPRCGIFAAILHAVLIAYKNIWFINKISNIFVFLVAI